METRCKCRLQRLGNQISPSPCAGAQQKGGELSSTAGSSAEKLLMEQAQKGSRFAANAEFPVRNPYGYGCPVPEYVDAREKERAPMQAFMEKVKNREAPVGSDALAYVLFGEGNWPYLSASDIANRNPYTTSPEMDEMKLPVLKMIVDMVKKKTNSAPYDPRIDLATIYTDKRRYEAEVQQLYREKPIVVGYAPDLGFEANNYRRFEVCGKSVLLTRGEDGKFRAFENRSPARGGDTRRGMELVSREDPPNGNSKLLRDPVHGWSYATATGERVRQPDDNDDGGAADAMMSLVELPAREKAGVLIVISGPKPGLTEAEVEAMFEEAMPTELENEFKLYRFDKQHFAAEQTFKVEANWKKVYDTYGECYHVGTLHKGVRDTVAGSAGGGPGVAHFKFYGPRCDRMTFGRFTTQIMADGDIEEERWAEPSVMAHIFHIYHWCTNHVSFVFNQGNYVRSQIWPGEHVGETYVSFYFYTHQPPGKNAVKEFKALLDIIALDDMPAAEIIHKNMLSNPHAELVFGRLEAGITHHHKYNVDGVKLD